MMRILTTILLGFSLATCLVSCDFPAKEGPTVQLPVPDDPTITFKVWFKVGSQNDPAGKEGLASLTGQMLAEASTTENSYEDILEKLYPMASSYGIRVDREMTTITGRTHKDNLETFHGLLTDAYLRPAFKKGDFERLKSNSINYLEKVLRYASDEELGKAALYDFVLGGTRYAHPSVGTVQGLKSITLDDVKRFYSDHYTRESATVAVGGGFDEAVVARCEKSLLNLPESMPEAVAPPRPEAIQGRQVLLVSKPGADASISFGFPIDVHRGDRDFYALWLANSWLGEHRNSASHLYQVIREARGMNYGDYSYIEAFPQAGQRNMPPVNVARRQQIFEVWIRTLPNKQAHFALRAAVRELQKLVDDGLTEEEFQLTRSFLKKYALHFAETTTARLGYAVDDRFYGIDGPGHLARFQQVMDELTAEEVNATIKKHLQYDNLKIAMVTGEAEKLKQALESDAPSPMTYASEKPNLLQEDEAIAAYALNIKAEKIRTIPVEEIFEK